VEIGPGKVLQGLVKRINRDAKFSGVDKFEDLERYM
jgi:malonyl CoA-acyl carrier protein transacylase